MLKKTHLITIFIVLIFLTFSYSNVFALFWYQSTSINNDKSGTIKIFYKTANSELKEAYINNFFPFSEEKIKEIFSSDNNIIQNIVVNKKKEDSTFVSITLSFKNINKINTASAFSNVKTTWYKNGDSTVFMYNVDKNDELPDNINASCTFELPTNEIMRSSGTKKGDNIFSLPIKSSNFKTGWAAFSVFKNSTDSPNNETTTGKDEKESGDGCGLFGIEMPLILGLGMLLIKRRYKK